MIMRKSSRQLTIERRTRGPILDRLLHFVRTGSIDTGTGSHRCLDDRDGLAADIRQELLQSLKNFMSGFMNDAGHTGADGSPKGRSSWPDAHGNPTDAWGSPLAHRKFFEWRAGGPGGVVNADGMRALLDAIGVDQTVCSKSVADGIIHGMDKGGDDNITTWPEYLNSIFSIGPVADVPTVDPTDAQIVAEGGTPTGSPRKPGGPPEVVGAPKRPAGGFAPDYKLPALPSKPVLPPIPTPKPPKAPVVVGGVLSVALAAMGVPLALAAAPAAIGVVWSFGHQRKMA